MRVIVFLVTFMMLYVTCSNCMEHPSDKDELKPKLFTALKTNRYEEAKEILSAMYRSTDGDAFNINAIKDKNGNTPLHIAGFSGNPDLVRLCFKYGAIIWQKNDLGQTPLAFFEEYMAELENFEDEKEDNLAFKNQQQIRSLLMHQIESHYISPQLQLVLANPAEFGLIEYDGTPPDNGADREEEIFAKKTSLLDRESKMLFVEEMRDVISRFFILLQSRSSQIEALKMLRELIKAMQNRQFEIGHFQLFDPGTLVSHSLLYHLLEARSAQNEAIAIGKLNPQLIPQILSIASALFILFITLIIFENKFFLSVGATAFSYGGTLISGRYYVPRLLPHTPASDWFNPLIQEMIKVIQEMEGLVDEETRQYIKILHQEEPESPIIKELYDAFCDEV